MHTLPPFFAGLLLAGFIVLSVMSWDKYVIPQTSTNPKCEDTDWLCLTAWASMNTKRRR